MTEGAPTVLQSSPLDQEECGMDIGAPELIVILLIVVLIFGVGRLSKIGGEMGGAIREFRKGLQGEPDEKQDRPDDTNEPPEVPPTS
jgi:sec-independent protein translocase protein TatA